MQAKRIRPSLALTRHPHLSGLRRLPPQAAGLALNLVGLSGLFGMMPTYLLPGYGLPFPITSLGLLIASALLQCAMLGRLFMSEGWLELESLHMSAANGALLVAIQLTVANATEYLSPAYPLFQTVAMAIEWSVCAFQLAIFVHFVHHIFHFGVRVEPFWTPVMLFGVTWSVMNPALGVPPWLQLGGILYGVVITAITWPPCMIRMLCQPDVCADPSVFMLMAPVAFLTLAIFNSANTVAGSFFDNKLAMTTLWGLNVASLLATFSAAFQRRHALLHKLFPEPVAGWVAVTFPMATNANVAMRFWRDVEAHRYAQSAVEVYGVLVGTAAFVIIPLVDLSMLLLLPRWIMAPAPLPASVYMDVPPSDSSADDLRKLERAFRLRWFNRASSVFPSTRASSRASNLLL